MKMYGAGMEGYYIRDTELKMLLAGCGVRRWYGLQSADETEPSGKCLTEAMAALYKKEYIDWTRDRKVRIREPLRQMIKTMAEALSCVLIRRKEKDYSMKCCYLSGDSVVMAERSQREEETLRLTMFTSQEWTEWLWKEGVFPEEEPFLKESPLPEDAEDLCPYREADRYFEEEGVTAVLDLLDAENGSTIERMILRQKGLQNIVSVQQGIMLESLPCRKGRCAQIIEGWFSRNAKSHP